MEQERIQKILAKYLRCSRRRAEDLIRSGRVFCNGSLVKLGDKALLNDKIFVDDILLEPAEEKKVYIMLNKPPGYLTTVRDERGRKTVIDLISDKVKERVYPVGRLDFNSQGLLLLTNDGEFCNMVLHPRNEIDKVYYVTVGKNITEADIKKLEGGVFIDYVKTKPCKVEVVFNSCKKSKFKITIHEGRKRQIRRMVKAVMKVEVEKLKRTQIGFLKLKDLPLGKFRYLTSKEVKKLII